MYKVPKKEKKTKIRKCEKKCGIKAGNRDGKHRGVK